VFNVKYRDKNRGGINATRAKVRARQTEKQGGWIVYLIWIPVGNKWVKSYVGVTANLTRRCNQHFQKPHPDSRAGAFHDLRDRKEEIKERLEKLGKFDTKQEALAFESEQILEHKTLKSLTGYGRNKEWKYCEYRTPREELEKAGCFGPSLESQESF
jgi:predicted GIY-YIG superfamily endonuclease